MNSTFMNRLRCQQLSTLRRIFCPDYVIPSCALFYACPEITSNFGKEKQFKCTFSTLELHRCQGHSDEQNLNPKLKRSATKCKVLKKKRQARDNQALNVKRCGKVMTSMLHKTYWNMKDRKLVDVGDFSHCARGYLQTADLMNLEKTFYPSRKNLSKERDKNNTISILEEEEEQSKTLSGKERFFQQMYIKYEDPNFKEATILAQCYPDPEQIFEEVVLPLMEARGLPLPKPVVTGHLREVYWKAYLTLPGTSGLIATHRDRDTAVRNVYLRACEQLEKLGLMWREKEDKWHPMASEKVVSMLETLAKYIESSLTASKGRGFKIILNQAEKNSKSLRSDNQAATQVNACENFKNKTSRLHCWTPFDNCCENLVKNRSVWEKGKLPCSVYKLENKVQKHEEQNTFDGGNPSIADSSHVSTGPVETMQCFPDPTDLTDAPEESRIGWICTVHVGWPFPFTVRAQGVSLPGAQMLGFMEVAKRLKAQGLLTSCNSGLSPQVLGRLMVLDLQAHWEKSLNVSLEQILQQKVEADAELFCDASITGFGAYLVLKDVGKVRWLCESWKEHDSVFLNLVYPRKWMFESTLAELYTTVTSVYSWKKKLRGKTLLCFTDNQTVVGLINTYMENPVGESYCLNTLDRLVSYLQATCVTYTITLQAVWVDRERNNLADLLSRKKSAAFCDTVPEAAVNKTKAKR
ncbi:hypothetical protein EGW08_015786, partial [Elysia chlorotica]